ncbi:MAG: CBS domain-containing protein [Crocinitomix sp.]|nr:CBS domain-containing protein [Crocinitomix sp.]
MKATIVSDIMTKEVECVTPEQKIVDVKHIYEKGNFHHHIPVTENNKLVGMISLIDFMRRIGSANLDDRNAVYQESTVKDIMTFNPQSTSPSATIEEVARTLSSGEFHALPVVEEEMVVGIVTTADLIRHFLDKDS